MHIFLRKLVQVGWSFPIILTLMALCVHSYFAITSATSNNELLRTHPSAQLGYVIMGFVLYAVLAFLPYQWLVQVSPTLYAAGVCLLVACYIPHLGSTGHGAKSWLKLGPLRFEPAEFTKLAFILAMAWFLRVRENNIQSFSTVLLAWIFTAIPFALVLKQPALGTASVFFPVCFAMLWAAGARPHHLIIPLLLVGSVIVLSYYWVHVWNKPVPFLKPFQQDRIKVFFDPSSDRRDKGYQADQATIALGSGGMDGMGWRKGVETELGYLPKGAVDNDMIFPVVGEDFGFRGAAALIIAEGIVLLWCSWVAASARDKIGALVAVGVMTMLFTHVFVNIGMTIQLVPITGIPLPFVSYGGTFLVVCLAALGLVQSVWVHRLNLERR
jgi:rod shape determining protein RodA